MIRANRSQVSDSWRVNNGNMQWIDTLPSEDEIWTLVAHFFYLQKCVRIWHTYRHKCVRARCSISVCLFCLSVCLCSFTRFIVGFNVGRNDIRACVSIMPREYQCYDNSFNSIASNLCFGVQMASWKKVERVWRICVRLVHSPYSDWINVSSDLESRNSIAMTNGGNEHSIHQKITCFRFVFCSCFFPPENEF